MARVVVTGMPHHITDRGTRRFDVFRDELDRLTYLTLLRESCQRFSLRIWAYCLMTNHVHFVAVPELPDSIWRTFHRTDGMYSKRFNARYGYVGHLWQERPFSCVLEGRHLWNAIRYVEANPVRAGMVSQEEQYRWSSARTRRGVDSDDVLDRDRPVSDSSEWIDPPETEDFGRLLRDRTSTGRPCGDDEFIRQIESLTGRDLFPKKPGPKPAHAVPTSTMLWTED